MTCFIVVVTIILCRAVMMMMSDDAMMLQKLQKRQERWRVSQTLGYCICSIVYGTYKSIRECESQICKSVLLFCLPSLRTRLD